MPDMLVLADDVRRHLGLPRLDPAEVLDRQAQEFGLQLEVTADWAGRPAVRADQAAQLVHAVEQATAAAARRQAQAEHEHAAQEALADQRLQARANAVFQHVAETTGDLHAALALGHTAGRGEVSDDQLAATLDSALGRWEQGFQTFDPVLRPGHERFAGAVDYDDLAAAKELQQPVTKNLVEKELSPRARRRFRELLRGTAE